MASKTFENLASPYPSIKRSHSFDRGEANDASDIRWVNSSDTPGAPCSLHPRSNSSPLLPFWWKSQSAERTVKRLEILGDRGYSPRQNVALDSEEEGD